jgi:uncharacterized protein (DUF3084 family)
LLSVRTKKPSREIAQRDECLLQREARIASLEATISELEKMLQEREASVRQREKLSETKICASRRHTPRAGNADRVARGPGSALGNAATSALHG